ncbi:MAG: MBL fold metallo-hydrolase [Thermodesulfobacteriota bacterium]
MKDFSLKNKPIQQPVNLTVLCENCVSGSMGLIGEHGWAIGIESENGKILFDTGQGQGIVNNSDLLGFDLTKVDKIVLSHGHYDHCSGLAAVLEQCPSCRVLTHPQLFGRRVHQGGDEIREIGVVSARQTLESMGATFSFNREFSGVGDGIYLTGEVPRVTDFEQPDQHLMRDDGSGSLTVDHILDDQSLVVDHERGLVVVLGCAHAGMINILNHIARNLPGRPFHTVIGGTHLGFFDDERFSATVEALQNFNITTLAAAHCTGLERGAELARIFGGRFQFAPVGTRLQIG